MKKVIGVLLLILALTTACQQNSTQGVITKPIEHNIESTSTSFKQPEITVESRVVNNEEYQYAVHYPKIDSDLWNVELADWADRRITQFKEDVGELNQIEQHWPYELHIDFEMYDVTDSFISVKLNESKFLGGAHTEETIVTFNYDRDQKQFLTIADLFNGNANYLQVLSDLSYEKLMELPEIKELVWDESFQAGIDPTIDNFVHYVIGDGDLIIFFQRYQVGPNSIGSPSVVFSEDDFKSIVLKEPLGATVDQDEEKLEITVNPPSNEEPKALNPDKKHVALTFDDGPHHTVTPRILDILNKYDAHATFFVLGNRVEFHPEILVRIKEEGHEIGNHTWSHPQLTNLSQEEIAAQVSKTDNQIQSVIGEASTVVRPPYGAVNELTKQVIKRPIVNWSVDTEDWKNKDPLIILKKIQNQVFDGAIILMHDIYPTTADSVDDVLSWLDTEGYQVVTVSQLLGFDTDEESIEVGKVYNSQ